MHTNKGDGQFKRPSLASFEYELPAALRQLLLRRASFLILNLQIIHDLRHVRHPSCRFLGARALVFRVDFSGWAVRPAKFVPSGMRENPLGGKAGHANQKVQARADRDDAATD